MVDYRIIQLQNVDRKRFTGINTPKLIRFELHELASGRVGSTQLILEVGVKLTPIQLYTMNYTIDSTTFARDWDFWVLQVYGVYAEVLLYGILLVLFWIAAHVLYHWTGRARNSLAIATSAMAILATAQVAIHVHGTVVGLQLLRLAIEGEIWPAAAAVGPFKVYARLYAAKDFLLVTNNAITDSLFIYRCFVVYERNFHVVILPMLMLLATTVLGYISTYFDDLGSAYYIDNRIVFAMAVFTNVVLMIMTAGRIWWIRRDACIVLEPVHVRKYNTVIAIILESGVIYCLSIILYLVSVSVSKSASSLAVDIFRSIFPQIMNIASTLIIVRVGLGRSVEGVSVPTSPSEGFGSTFSSVIDIGTANGSERGGEISMIEVEK
ncbi:hypothetical protein MVEN_02223000 [Mycena venus]|uniref:Uncharacterized protein n=1 Tax=Mycena venus TaxID=2733690 RepID=A0A8H7CFF3_9AGAR|nr:hypothetical protein MVEN_02223000 [Mycena venus]